VGKAMPGLKRVRQDTYSGAECDGDDCTWLRSESSQKRGGLKNHGGVALWSGGLEFGLRISNCWGKRDRGAGKKKRG